MKKNAVIAALLALLTALAACGVQTLPTDADDVPSVEDVSQPEGDGQTVTKVVYVPMWMQDYSVVYYDANLNRTVEKRRRPDRGGDQQPGGHLPGGDVHHSGGAQHQGGV